MKLKINQNSAALLLALTICLAPAAQARGGGGGHGGGGGFHGGGEYRGGGGYRDDFGGYGSAIHGEENNRGGENGDYRGYDFGGDGGMIHGGEAGRGDYTGYRGDNYRGADAGLGNVDTRPRVSEADLRSGADKTYDYAKTNGLSTDSGFGRLNTYEGVSGAGHDLGQTHPLAQASLVDHGADVRSNWAGRNHDYFDRGWWDRHNGWWGYDGWGDGWWGGVGWDGLAPYWGMAEAAEPVDYNYGNNITYQGTEVYYGTQPTATTVQYYQQAQTLANSAPAIPTSLVNGKTKISGDWKPLGIFSLNAQGETASNTIFQLAVNKAGVISGNYYNTLNDQTTPIHGKVDKKNMRAAFIVGKNKDVVYDTGLANLLEAQSTILVHLTKDKTQQEVMVRLDAPKNSAPGKT